MKSRHRDTTSFFYKVVAFNILFTLILSVISQSLVYELINRTVRPNFEHSNLQNLSKSLDNIERYVTGPAVSVSHRYFSGSSVNQDILYPVQWDISQDPQRAFDLKEKLYEIAVSHNYIDSMDIYYPRTNLIVTGFRSLHFDADSEDIEKFLPWYDDFQSFQKGSALLAENANNYPQKNRCLTYVTRMPLFSEDEPMAVIAMHISTRAFADFLDENADSFMMVDKQGDTLYALGDADLFAEIRNDQLEERLAGVNTSASILPLDTDAGEPLIVAKRSDLTDAYYLYAVAQRTFYQDYRVFNLLFRLLCLTAILLNIAVALVISRRTNSKYRGRVKLLADHVGIVLDEPAHSFDDSIMRLARRIELLDSTIRSATPTLLGNSIRAVLFGQADNRAMQQLQKALTYPRICCALLVPAQETRVIPPEDAIHHDAGFQICLTPLEDGRQLALISFEEEAWGRALETLSGYRTENVLMARGCRTELSETGIIKSYQEACALMRYRYLFPGMQKISEESIDLNSLRHTGSHMRLFSQIERALTGRNAAQALEFAHRLIEAFRTGSYSIDYCLSTLRDLVSLLYRLMQSHDLDMWVILGYDMRSHFERLENIDDFERWLDGLLEIIVENMDQKQKQLGDWLPLEIVRLVEENLDKEISLELLADKLGIRSDALSRMFKSAVGKNYSEYIKDKKMERAVELLKDGRSTVKEIAEKLGYRSSQYFIKVFKLEFGETPSLYRKNTLRR